jgi:rRNA-processing protein FCF1
VIIDTSSILFGFANGKNVIEIARSHFHSIPIIISKGILRELSSKSKNGGAKGVSAKVAMLAISNSGIKIIDSNIDPDRWIISSSSKGVIVITNDTALARQSFKGGAIVYKLSKDGKLRKFIVAK